MLAWVCGDVCIWKPSEKTPLCGIACQKIIQTVFKKNNVPEGVSCLVSGGREVGEWMSNDNRVPLVSPIPHLARVQLLPTRFEGFLW